LCPGTLGTFSLLLAGPGGIGTFTFGPCRCTGLLIQKGEFVSTSAADAKVKLV
jgi:hypothetical protein